MHRISGKGYGEVAAMSKEKKTISGFERYLRDEIGIEFKACLHFFAITLMLSPQYGQFFVAFSSLIFYSFLLIIF